MRGRQRFTARLKAAVATVSTKLKLEDVQKVSLYTPVRRGGAYEWIRLMDSDGLLVTTKKVQWGAKDEDVSELRIGVVIQSESSTSLTKPNAFGKALVGKLPLGIWVDVKARDNGERRRVRLDHAYVLFVLPTPAAKEKAKIASKAAQNVANALEAADDVHVLPIPMGSAASKMAELIESTVRGWLVGRGRPRSPI